MHDWLKKNVFFLEFCLSFYILYIDLFVPYRFVFVESRATKNKVSLKQATPAPIAAVPAAVETASVAATAADDDEDVDLFGLGIF